MLEPKLLHHIHEGDGPTVGVAVHAGHEIRPDLLRLLELDEIGRLREEDPFTDFFTFACDTQVMARRSRFEVDLNRARDQALCVRPEDCWGLEVWKPEAADAVMPAALDERDAFYSRFGELLRRIEARHGHFVVFDLHSYNHRRDGPDAPPAPEDANPEINLGTGTMDRDRWAHVVEHFLATMRAADIRGRKLDVRENVKFRGREVARFVHEEFPRTGCGLAIEMKKTFMDEWTGEFDRAHLWAIRQALGTVAREMPRVLAQGAS